MDIVIKSFVLGVITLFVWKVFKILFKFRELCKKLRYIPQKPSHWLKGHADEV